jgi:hypothetical protein
MSNGLIDTYDSSAGTYASQVVGGHAGSDVRVASNGNITLSGAAAIWGDATPGPSGTVAGAVGVSGSTAPASAPFPVPTYTYSPTVPASGALTSTTSFASGTYRYTSVALNTGDVATINGNVVWYVDGSFLIAGTGYTSLLPGATLTIHHGSGDFTISGTGVINQGQDPANLSIHSATTSSINVSGSAAFYGQLFAPQATLIASGSAGIYGSARASTLSLSGGMNLHFDRQLGGSGELAVRLVRPLGRTAGKS